MNKPSCINGWSKAILLLGKSLVSHALCLHKIAIRTIAGGEYFSDHICPESCLSDALDLLLLPSYNPYPAERRKRADIGQTKPKVKT